MRPADYITTALRNIWRQKLRSLLTIFAVVIGALSVTIMLALVFSARGFMTKQFEQSGLFQQVIVSPQTDITWKDQGNGGQQCPTCVRLDDDLIGKIGHLQHVIGVSRVIYPHAFEAMELGGNKVRVNTTEAHDVNGIQKTTLVAGREFGPSDGTGKIIITKDYADKLGFTGRYNQLVGQSVDLLTQNYYSGEGSDPVKQQQQMQDFANSHQGVGNGQDFQPTPVTLKATIVGIADATDSSYTVRVPITWARGLAENIQYQPQQQSCSRDKPCVTIPAKTITIDQVAKNGYDGLVVKVDQASNAKQVAQQIKSLGVGASDAQSFINQQLAIFNIVGIVLGSIGGIALIVATIGVVNTMVMAILERTREIGIMRAVGARRSTVSRLFTIEASLLGFLGGVVGLAIGYLLTLVANPIINKQLAKNGLAAKDIVTLPPWLIVGVIVITTFIGLLAGLYPAARAARLDPVEALHYE